MSTNIPNLSSSSTQTLTSNSEDLEKLLNELPKARFYEAQDIYKWEGFWIIPQFIEGAIAFRSRFQARDDDVLLASTAKTGTTWLKALSLSIMHYEKHLTSDILTTGSPHFHLPSIEAMNTYTNALPIDIYDASAARLLHTHLRYSILPDSVKNSACKIMYICRNPKDTLVSMWYFYNSVLRPSQDPYPLEKAFDCFCSGVQLYGSFFDHVLEYWVESKKRPKKIMFVKYEELKSDPKGQVSKIAEFLGRPLEDENEVDEVLCRSSFERLKNLEVNNSGNILTIKSLDVGNGENNSPIKLPNTTLYRKGEVGDWKNHLTPEMAERIDQISRAKLEPFGLFL